jgi:hypothetical protein
MCFYEITVLTNFKNQVKIVAVGSLNNFIEASKIFDFDFSTTRHQKIMKTFSEYTESTYLIL